MSALGLTVRMLISLILLATSTRAAAQDLVLGGAVVASDRFIPKAWIVIKNGRIDAIVDTLPAGSVIETDGVIFPGFVDLHNHPMYNIFKRWTPSTKYHNRYEWRDSPEYRRLIGTPGSELQRADDQTFCDIDQYVEVKALIGGTTSIAGISPRSGVNPPVPTCLIGLARNLDWASGLSGATVANERIENLLGVTPRDLKEDSLQRISGRISSKTIDLLLVHLAEGTSADMESTVEFRALKGVGLLGDHTAIIHGAALASADFQQMRAAGTALVWSPRSNLELYGSTANIAEAFRQGVSIALAPDWSPTGSVNMLAELQFASHLSESELSGLFSDRQLFEMATAIPARIARIDDKVGLLKIGGMADLFVLSGNLTQPYAALATARPQDVHLVLVGGVPLYGTETLMGRFPVQTEAIEICDTKRLLNSTALTAGTFAAVRGRLTSALAKYGLELAPPVECARQ